MKMRIITKVFFVLFFALHSKKCLSQSEGVLSIVVDPKMAIEGPYETSEYGEIDLTIRLACGHDKYELGLYTELFPAIEYYGFGLFYNYRILLEKNPREFHHWVIPVGLDVGFIKRNQDAVEKVLQFNFALNGGVRYFFTRNIGLELGVNYRYRSDLEEIYNDNFQMRANMYTGVIFVWM